MPLTATSLISNIAKARGLDLSKECTYKFYNKLGEECSFADPELYAAACPHIPCPECSGTGKIEEVRSFSEPKHHPVEEDCPGCINSCGQYTKIINRKEDILVKDWLKGESL